MSEQSNEIDSRTERTVTESHYGFDVRREIDDDGSERLSWSVSGSMDFLIACHFFPSAADRAEKTRVLDRVSQFIDVSQLPTIGTSFVFSDGLNIALSEVPSEHMDERSISDKSRELASTSSLVGLSVTIIRDPGFDQPVSDLPSPRNFRMPEQIAVVVLRSDRHRMARVAIGSQYLARILHRNDR